MRNISLDFIDIKNFKGVSAFRLGLDGKDAYIFGRNAAGKTTLMDAFRWLMFGTDSTGRTDFQVRPVDKYGRMVDNIDIEVEAQLSIDGEPVTLKKTQKQNWVKKRGSDAPTFQGNTNSYEVNGFPASQTEFNQKVSDIIGEDLFKLLTNPKSFPAMKWSEQRKILLRFVSDITDADVLDTDADKYSLIADDVKTAGADKAKEKVASTLKALKNDQKSYPVRIDEASRTITPAMDADAIGEKRTELERQLKDVQDSRDSLNKGLADVSGINDQIMRLKLKMSEIERSENDKLIDARNNAFAEYRNADAEAKQLSEKLGRAIDDLDNARSLLEADLKSIEEFRAEYKAVKAWTLPENETVCPTCGRPFEQDKISEISEQFEDRKRDALEAVTVRGNSLQERINATRSKIAKIEEEIADLKTQAVEATAKATALKTVAENAPLVADLSGNTEYMTAEAEIDALRRKLASMDDGSVRKAELTLQEGEIRLQITELDRQVAIIEANARAEQRIAQLKEEQMDCSQKISDQEQKLFLLEEFIRAKMDMLSEKINSHFKHVRFRLFTEQINGGMKETCVMQIASNGSYVDYADANSAAQIQGGLDVINALSELYQVTAPIWIDNRESVTDIPDVNAQVINLIVSPTDEHLRVVTE